MGVFTGITAADSFSDGSANPFYPPIDSNNLPLPASFTAIGASTSYTSSPASSSSSAGQPEVITENQLTILKNQSVTHMVVFKNDGTLKAVCTSGNGFELFSKKGGEFPGNVTFRSEYGKSSMVTSSNPVSLDITPGTWYFTVFTIGDTCSYDLTASQNSPVSSTSSGSGSSFSSSMGVNSLSFG